MRYLKGQSVAEVVVGLTVLIPLLLVLASFTNLLSLSTTSVQAGRLAAWQRTVYKSDNSGLSPAQVEQRIVNNIDRIFVDSENGTATPRYDYAQGRATGATRPQLVDLDADVALKMPEVQNASWGEIHNQATGIAQRLRGAVSVDTPALVSPTLSIPLDEDGALFKLMSAGGMAGNTYTDPTGPMPYDPVAEAHRYHLSSSAALLTAGSWAPSTPEVLQEAVSAAAMDGSVLQAYEGAKLSLPRLFTDNIIGTWLGSVVLGLKELRWVTNAFGQPVNGAHETSVEAQAEILPPGMGTF
jgi:hypothetical protein